MGRATGDGRGWVAPLPCRVSRCVFVFICGYLGLGRNANPWAFLSSLQLLSEGDQVYRKPRQRAHTSPFPFPFTVYSLRTTRQRWGRLCSLGAIGASLVLSLPKPSFVFAHDRRRRASSAHSHTHPHMSIGTCQSAQNPASVVARSHSFFFTPSPLPSLSRWCTETLGASL